MKFVRQILLGIAAIVAGLAQPALAQQTTCFISGNSTAAPATYDPFNPVGLPVTDISMVVTRQNAGGGGDPRIVNMYLTSSPQADGSIVEVISVLPFGGGSVQVDGVGLDIFYDSTEPKPAVLPTSLVPGPTNRFIKINFTGNNADSDKAIINFRVTLPANLDLDASTNLSFDGNYGCFIRGGQGNGIESESFFPGAITFPITVLSALQATYAGTALDFGEIGDVTDADVAGSPAAYVTPPVNYVRVQSSGPYSIELTSQNNYTLTPGASGIADPLQRVDYRLKFLGQERDTSNSTPIDYICPRAGVGVSAEDRLYLQAQLAEGGAGKLPSPDYRDLLTVTIAPLAASTPITSPGECSNLSGQF